MTNGLTSPRAAERPPGPTPQAARGAPPPSDAFAGMLDAHQARTAIAEGHSPEKAERHAAHEAAREAGQKPEAAQKPAGDENQAPHDPAVAGEQPQQQPSDSDATKPVDATTLAATVLAALVPVATAPVAEAKPVAAAVATATPGETATAVPVAVPDAAAVTAEALSPSAPATGETAADASATLTSAAPVKADGSATDAQPVISDAKPVAQPSQPQGGAQGQAKGDQQGQPQQQQQPATPQPAASAPAAAQQQTPEQARVAAAYARPAEHQQATPATPATPANVQPVAASTLRPADLPAATPVPLARSAEAVEHVLRLASARGVTHARIALHPQELGSIDLHIRSTNEGIVARVVAHSAESVQTLQNAANDLRKSLEEQGVNVLNLDIGHSGERSAGRSGSESGGTSYEGPAAEGSDETPTETTSTLRLPNGVLVDVLA